MAPPAPAWMVAFAALAAACGGTEETSSRTADRALPATPAPAVARSRAAPPRDEEPGPDAAAATAPIAELRARVVAAEDGTAIAGASITASFSAPGVASERTYRTDYDGAVVLEPPSGWTASSVRVAAPGFVAERYGPGPEAFADGAWRIELARGVVVEGRVRDTATRLPLRGATVWLYSGRSRTMWGTSGGPLARADTDEEGRFRTHEAPNDRVRVYVEAPGHVPSWNIVACPPDEPLEVPMAPAGRVRGVVRAADGAPARGVRVTVDVDGWCLPPFAAGAGAETDADGRFDLDGVPLGSRFAVRADADDASLLRAARGGLELAAAGNAVECDLMLATASLVKVRVLGPDGAGVHCAHVVVAPGGRCSESTDDDGAAEIERVAAGPQIVVVESEDYVRTEVPLEVAEATDASVEVRLVRGGTLRCTVLDAEGRPACFADVRIDDLDAPPGLRRRTRDRVGGDGRLAVHLTPGRYELRADRGNANASADIEIADGATTDVTLQLAAR